MVESLNICASSERARGAPPSRVPDRHREDEADRLRVGDSKAIGCAARTKAQTGSLIVLMRPCGIATP
jgi:hypothetical protein